MKGKKIIITMYHAVNYIIISSLSSNKNQSFLLLVPINLIVNRINVMMMMMIIIMVLNYY